MGRKKINHKQAPLNVKKAFKQAVHQYIEQNKEIPYNFVRTCCDKVQTLDYPTFNFCYEEENYIHCKLGYVYNLNLKKTKHNTCILCTKEEEQQLEARVKLFKQLLRVPK